LGQGTLEDEHWPTQIAALNCLELNQLVAGSRNSLGINEQGRVYTWGWNQRGTLGFAGENKAESEPQELTGLAGKNIVQVRAVERKHEKRGASCSWAL
jgi:alpha-tubulin suppressor-like RCC1 family protein